MNPFRSSWWQFKETARITARRAWAKAKAGAPGCDAVFKAVYNAIKIIHVVVMLSTSLVHLPSETQAAPVDRGKMHSA